MSESHFDRRGVYSTRATGPHTEKHILHLACPHIINKLISVEFGVGDPHSMQPMAPTYDLPNYEARINEFGEK